MKTIITFLTCITLTFSVYAQTEKQIMADIDKTITDIKSKINTFQKIEKGNTSKGYRFVFLKGKELQLITVRAIEENLEKNVEWYYVNGVLVYAETIWLDSKTKKVVKNEKTYLDNGHLIAWINPDGKLVDSNSSEFKTVETELTAYGIKIKNEALK
jgi:outer membrane lipoprotein-sorting protein